MITYLQTGDKMVVEKKNLTWNWVDKGQKFPLTKDKENLFDSVVSDHEKKQCKVLLESICMQNDYFLILQY